ncbi:hypothetical protein BN1423_2230030 [Carnobacterium maltaromaticum]|nr:hypothetical protein CM318V1_200075 [Carnobacterium maltaromaticum]CRH22074.1 hypothetical protein BN1423_2230030 [Carnobacterium maltaromaticum]
MLHLKSKQSLARKKASLNRTKIILKESNAWISKQKKETTYLSC